MAESRRPGWYLETKSRTQGRQFLRQKARLLCLLGTKRGLKVTSKQKNSGTPLQESTWSRRLLAVVLTAILALASLPAAGIAIAPLQDQDAQTTALQAEEQTGAEPEPQAEAEQIGRAHV
jgi:hypothetical protein